MKLFKILAVALGIATLFGTQHAEAKDKLVAKMYAFGVSTSFNDSTVYITDIQELDSAWVDSKTNFLLNREDYSYQMNTYFNELGQKHRTCVIIYDVNRAKLAKKFERAKKRYMGKNDVNVKYLSDKDFHFSPIVPDTDIYDEEVVEEKPQPKQKGHKPEGRPHPEEEHSPGK